MKSSHCQWEPDQLLSLVQGIKLKQNSKHTECYYYPITLGNYHATAIFCNTKTQLPSNDSTPHYQQNILVLYYHKIETLAGCYGYEMGWGNSLDQGSLFQAVAAGWKYLVQDDEIKR